MLESIKKLAVEEEGADATEYALLAALVAVAIILGATFLGTNINLLFNKVGVKLDGVSVP